MLRVSRDQRFSASALLTFWTRQFSTVRGCPVPCRVLSASLSGLCKDRLPQSVTTQSVFRHCQMFPGWCQITPVENHCLRLKLEAHVNAGRRLYSPTAHRSPLGSPEVSSGQGRASCFGVNQGSCQDTTPQPGIPAKLPRSLLT